MKYTIHLFAFLVFITVSQVLKAQYLIGVRAGTTVSADFLSSLDQQKVVYGSTYGIIFKHANQPIMGTQMEFNYATRGWHNLIGDSSYMKGTLNYVEWKLLTHAQIGKKSAKFTLNGGPHLGYLLKATEEKNLNGVITNDSYDKSNFPQDRFDYGLVFGLGAVYELGMGDVQLDVNYTLSLSTLTADNTVIDYDFRTNQPISISIAWLFCPQRIKNNK